MNNKKTEPGKEHYSEDEIILISKYRHLEGKAEAYFDVIKLLTQDIESVNYNISFDDPLMRKDPS